MERLRCTTIFIGAVTLLGSGCSTDPFPRSSLPRFRLQGALNSPTELSVTWDAVSHATAYRLDCFNVRNQFQDSTEVAPEPKAADVMDLDEDTKYFLRTTALDNGHEIAVSNVVHFSTPRVTGR